MKQLVFLIMVMVLVVACGQEDQPPAKTAVPQPSPTPHQVVADCNLGSNPIWEGVFEDGNLDSLTQTELLAWQGLDQNRGSITSDEDLQQYARMIISQLANSEGNTPFSVVGDWISQNQGVIEIVDELAHPEGNAAFTFNADGTLVIRLKRSFLENSFALSAAFSFVHEFTHAAYQQANTTMPPSQSFCAEYQPYSVAMAAYLSARHAFQDVDYSIWMDAVDADGWWYGNKWISYIVNHLNSSN